MVQDGSRNLKKFKNVQKGSRWFKKVLKSSRRLKKAEEQNIRFDNDQMFKKVQEGFRQ